MFGGVARNSDGNIIKIQVNKPERGGDFMKLTFLGATHEVTGSCFLLEACGKRVLVDCGMEQGPDIYKNEELPVKASDVDMVLLTHAHMDHSGKLPLLYRQGFQGQIFCNGVHNGSV